jgi:multicomponent Na+:H+ antiporter subunit G
MTLSLSDIIVALLLIIGTLFMVIASIGIVRMPDVFLRMSVSAKATTLGIICMMLALAIHFNNIGITSRALATAIFLFVTAPLASHMLSRAAYFDKEVQPCKETFIDELRGHYDAHTHTLEH